MNLRWFHALLILFSAALAVLFGFWCLSRYGRGDGTATLVAAIVSFAVSFALVSVLGYEKAPLIFEVRGLPMNASVKDAMDAYRGSKVGVVEKSGAWFSYDGNRIGQGRENAKAFLKENPKVAAAIEKAIRQNAGLIVDKLLIEEQTGEEGEEPDEDGVLPDEDDGGKKPARAKR